MLLLIITTNVKIQSAAEPVMPGAWKAKVWKWTTAVLLAHAIWEELPNPAKPEPNRVR